MTASIFAAVQAKPDAVLPVEAALRRMMPLTRAAPGCIRYELFGAKERPGTFHLLETDAARFSHRASQHFAARVASLSGKLAREIEIERLEPLPHALSE